MTDIAYDWIKRAREASKRPDECARCLREAEAIAARADDWSQIAEAWAEYVPDGEADARRCLAAAFARADRDEGTFVDAASVLGRHLADRDGARAALVAGVDYLAGAAETRSAQWLRIASNYALVLADRDAAHAVIDRAFARLAEPGISELCDFGAAYIEHTGDEATGRALIERAAVLDETVPGEEWRLLSAFVHKLGDPDRGWGFIERGVARAATVSDCVSQARTVAIYAEGDPARGSLALAALARAEALAATAADWLVVAGAHHDRRASADDIRRCLDRALGADTDGAARAQIAHGHRHWLADPEGADALAPRGIAPEAIAVAVTRLDGWDPAPAALLDRLRAQITSTALDAMASRDYGQAVDRHRAALDDIVATGLVPQPLAWHPREVVELTRWTQGADTDHVARAFACAILCIDAAGPQHEGGVVESTIPVLIESCLELGADAVDGAIGLLVSVVEARGEERYDTAFALLGVIIAAAARDASDPRLPALCDRVIAHEAACERYAFGRPEEGWLFRLTNFTSRFALWRSLAEQILAPHERFAELAARLRRS